MPSCRVVAGPGSGKTRVLISRIAHLLNHHQVPAYQVLAITFTNEVQMGVEILHEDIAYGGDINKLYCSKLLCCHACEGGNLGAAGTVNIMTEVHYRPLDTGALVL